jgi:hypothetical protein
MGIRNIVIVVCAAFFHCQDLKNKFKEAAALPLKVNGVI